MIALHEQNWKQRDGASIWHSLGALRCDGVELEHKINVFGDVMAALKIIGHTLASISPEKPARVMIEYVGGKSPFQITHIWDDALDDFGSVRFYQSDQRAKVYGISQERML